MPDRDSVVTCRQRVDVEIFLPMSVDKQQRSPSKFNGGNSGNTGIASSARVMAVLLNNGDCAAAIQYE